MAGFSEEDFAEEVKKLLDDLAKIKDELRNAQRRMKKQGAGKKPPKEEGCYGCNFIRNCPQWKESMQGKRVPAAGPAIDPLTKKRIFRVGELLFKGDALYATGRVSEVEVKLLLDSGCT